LAWKRGAPNLVLSGYTGAGDNWLDSFCSAPPDQFNVYCFEPDPSTTRGEGRAFARLAADNNWKSVIVVTARPHISRARLILQRCFPGEIIMVDSPGPIPWYRWIYEYAYQTAAFGRVLLSTGC